jgi:hypothetical protein
MRRLGFVSVGKVTALVTVVAVVAVLAVRGQGMFSPGPLNEDSRTGVVLGGVRSHAEASCSACHVPAWSKETMSSRCQDCHENVRGQMVSHGPLHGMLAEGKDCRSCHTEHKGAHAALTDMSSFDHECAGFRLTGKHKALDCAACHGQASYKNTPQTCVSCHAEPKVHKERYGTACAQCHGTDGWQVSTVSMAKFDHNLTCYRLSGKHAAVSCKACHVREPLDMLGSKCGACPEVFKGLPQRCESCHAEPKTHVGLYGLNCASCHSTKEWQDVTFRHSFPVSHGGGQKAKSCTTCHPYGASQVSFHRTGDFDSYTCYNCHQHDKAREQLRPSHQKVANLDHCTTCHPAGHGTVRRKTALELPERLVPERWLAVKPAAGPVMRKEGAARSMVMPVLDWRLGAHLAPGEYTGGMGRNHGATPAGLTRG